MVTGKTKTLQDYHIFDAPKKDDIELLFKQWCKARDELIQTSIERDDKKFFSSISALWRIERRDFYIRCILMSLGIMSSLVVPQIIGALATFYEDSEINILNGVLLSFGLLLAGLVRTEITAIVVCPSKYVINVSI